MPPPSIIEGLDSIRHLVPPQLRHAAIGNELVHAILEQIGIAKNVTLRSSDGDSIVADTILHRTLTRLPDLADFEPEMSEMLKTHLRPGMVAYDVGANIGVIALRMSNFVGPSGKVIAFEPEIRNLDYLLPNTSGRENIIVEKCAVTEETGKADIIRQGSVAMTMVGPQTHTPQHADLAAELNVRTVSIDDYVFSADSVVFPDLVKIDIEGGERRAFEGMEKLLSLRPPIIICELHPHLNPSANEVPEILRSMGYKSISLIKDRTQGYSFRLDKVLALPSWYE